MGTIFNRVVSTCTIAIVFKALELIQVKNQITPKPVVIAANLFSPRTGKNTSKYPTRATAIAALVHQIEIQYPQATKNPGSSPRPSLV